ncbi:unnamed protein product, partial [Prorocentrum cordatum]
WGSTCKRAVQSASKQKKKKQEQHAAWEMLRRALIICPIAPDRNTGHMGPPSAEGGPRLAPLQGEERCATTGGKLHLGPYHYHDAFPVWLAQGRIGAGRRGSDAGIVQGRVGARIDARTGAIPPTENGHVQRAASGPHPTAG